MALKLTQPTTQFVQCFPGVKPPGRGFDNYFPV